MKQPPDGLNNKNPGVSLLEKSQKGVLKLIFGRTGIVLLLLIANIGILFAAFAWLEDFLPQIYGGAVILIAGVVIYIINSRMDPTAKITWLSVIMLLPVFGCFLYLFTRNDIGHKTMKKRLQKVYSVSEIFPLKNNAAEKLSKKDTGISSMTQYVSGVTGIPVYENTEVTYFPCGEKMLDRLLPELEKAEKSIYLEFFIIDEGFMWGQILEILARKASQGVDVKVIYDGSCEFISLPKKYPKMLKELGISCRAFAPVTPFVSTHYNYRDHRKILTVDGKTAFTGGINLADEYINVRQPFGYWKDTAVMLCGDAAKGFERMFLQMWNLEEKNISFPDNETENGISVNSDGFVMPYCDDPLDNEYVGRQVYIDILNRAQRYVHIMTPYLILDGELESALSYSAKRGVDVTLLLPGIPDKKIPYAFAKSHYSSLIEAGVKIYEYTPGFVHAKVAVADDREAVVGSINLDYRSLYHHFECAAYLYNVPCIKEIAEDFDSSVNQSRAVTKQSIKKEKFYYKAVGCILKVIAPLM